MKRRLSTSEIIFKVLSYLFLTIFALCCLYPLVYSLSSSISGAQEVNYNEIILFPKNVQFKAYEWIFNNNAFWISYANTLFITLYGTIWAVGVSLLGAYALSKKRLLFRKQFNFFLVFTMWFSAGIVAQYLNYKETQIIFDSIGIVDGKWLIVIAMGMNATNIILLRNAFEGVPAEIEEAAIVDGATEMQVLTSVYIPMSKSTIATVTLFFAISRWNGYYWAKTMLTGDSASWPIQVFIRDYLDNVINNPETIWDDGLHGYALNSAMYAMLICAIIPILVIYPFIQKYFAKGTNMGGVKE